MPRLEGRREERGSWEINISQSRIVKLRLPKMTVKRRKRVMARQRLERSISSHK
jgi:hypothetical protein